MKTIPALWFAALTLLASPRLHAQADIPADFLSITGATGGTVSDGYGSPGSIPIHGRASFPLLIDANQVPAFAAGRCGNGTSPTAACGYLTKAISTSMSNTSTDLIGLGVFGGNFHDGFGATAIAKINAHSTAGGGVVVCSTPRALSATAFDNAQSVLALFGLSVSGSGTATSSFTVAASSYPAFHSALNGLDQLVADASGGPALSLADKRIAAGAVDRVLAVRPGQADLLAGLQTLEDSDYGLIPVTAAAPLVKCNKPVEAMLARFQSGKFDAMTAAQLIARPSASSRGRISARTAPSHAPEAAAAGFETIWNQIVFDLPSSCFCVVGLPAANPCAHANHFTPAAKIGWCFSPGMFFATRVPARSVWAILPKIRPQGLVMPSMANSEPFGLMSISIE